MSSQQPMTVEAGRTAGQPRGIVVPVSREESAGPALAYAAGEALRRGCPVLVVHVERSGSAALPLRRWRGLGAEAVTGLLLSCRRRLAGLLGGAVPVSTEARHGGVVATLVGLSTDAELVVLPAGHRDRQAPLPGLSVTNALAARAHCPVAVVPSGWVDRGRPDQPGDPSVVVAGLRDTADEEVLRAAFVAAAARDAVLHVVHAWEGPSSDPLATPRAPAGLSMTGVHHDVSVAVAEVARDHPTVPYAVIVLQGHPTAVLEERARDADLLVIGRFRARTTAGSLLGSTARDVLGGVGCPVLVVHVDWALDRRIEASAVVTPFQVITP